MSRLAFNLEKVATGSRARAARFRTLHGEVETPIFMPVGTQATVKSQTVESLKTVGANILLANTYHLLLRPGPEAMKKFGGIHRFMNWDRPVLTDSGGFQIFSLPHSREMSEEGAKFLSYIDKTPILLTPELSIQTQRAIGSDIMMVLDQCIPSTSSFNEAKLAMELTHRWAKRSLIAREDSPQSLFGIVQGACFEALRRESADALTNLHLNGTEFDGFAVGGLAVGESKAEREDFTELTAALLPGNRPRYLMGVGTPLDILEAVHRGIDLFDCILPGQLAQRGVAFTSLGKFQLRRGVYKFSEVRLDPNCHCSTCSSYSRAYLHHLVKAEEVLGWHLIALHNFTFYQTLMREIRESILADTFLNYYQSKRKELAKTDEENPSTPVKLPKRSRFEKQRTLGNYEVHLSHLGFASIRQKSSGEIMHSVNAPEVEANALYIAPSRFKERYDKEERVVVWDVGMGAGANAMGVVQEIEKLVNGTFPAWLDERPFCELVSYEIDLDPLKLAMKHKNFFTYLRHPAPNAILEKGMWKDRKGMIQWNLFLGNFLEEFKKANKPDLIYFDPFSTQTDSDLWTTDVFQRIHNYCGDKPMMLMTYSASTLVRARLLSTGFFVGYGSATGPKNSTTTAFNDLKLAKSNGNLLGLEWLDRFKRSEAQIPLEIKEKVLKHPQFQ